MVLVESEFIGWWEMKKKKKTFSPTNQEMLILDFVQRGMWVILQGFDFVRMVIVTMS